MKITRIYHSVYLLALFLTLNATNFNLKLTNSSIETTAAKVQLTNGTALKDKVKSCTNPQRSEFDAGTGTTILRPIVERVFSRKKRFLLAPAKTRLKFTMQISKRLLARIPSGFNFNIEAALYYPMITSRLDLIPKRLRPKTTPKPKPKGPTTPLIIQIPGSLIRYKAKPAAKPAKVQRIDESGQLLQWVDTKPVAQPTSAAVQDYTQPHKWQQWSKYGASDYAQRYDWTPTKQWTNKQPVWLSQDSKWTKWTTTPLPWASNKKWQQKADKWQQWVQAGSAGGMRTRNGRWKRDSELKEIENVEVDAFEAAKPELNSIDVLEELEEIEPMYAHFPELKEHYDWKHYHNYRDRRHLYHQLTGLSDIFPTKTGLQDEYSRIVQADFEKCDRELKSACPFNMLAWLMGQKQ
ncbi:unnamed protein product [Ceratitis capitata]|uniref:(Mediterranean fruit fly) hypothetical protein n=1 Tax=Ceratitis capitata TaxID=7213 RepID=A0A811U1X5_CERCA|nr:unnamed protein product [Ceratitis capitata]